MTEKTTFTLDGREVEAGPDETIWQVAEREHPVSASPRPAWWSTPPMNVRKPREKW